MILLKLEPSVSKSALVRALTHDQGEYVTGDLSYTFKRERPDIGAAVNAVADADVVEQGFIHGMLTSREEQLIKLSDWLDSYLWARHHEPNLILHRPSWNDRLESVSFKALDLGVYDEFTNILEGAYVD